jgi:hypothetical protein
VLAINDLRNGRVDAVKSLPVLLRGAQRRELSADPRSGFRVVGINTGLEDKALRDQCIFST